VDRPEVDDEKKVKDFKKNVRYVPYTPADPKKDPDEFYKDDFWKKKLDKREV
jgi:hypothetical protein